MSRPPITLVAAIGKNREIGKGPDLLWRLKGDLQRFKAVTTGAPIIMGRKTYESIGRPLPKRVNIVITRDTSFKKDGVVTVHSVERALEVATNLNPEQIFVIGGGEIYRHTLPYADTLDLTRIDAEDPDADVFFPPFEDKFIKKSEEEPQEENGISYQWVTYVRN
ncbi:MAG: dihydrofolate reductase [Patescibacteria group bacterium UBA2163]